MIKGLDNGYLYTKDNDRNIFPSAFSTEDKVVSNAIPITIDNKQYYTGIGKSTLELDDLLNLKRYHSLNLLSYEKGYWAGITKLPKPL